MSNFAVVKILIKYQNNMLKTILAIAGKPGLFRLVSQGTGVWEFEVKIFCK